jgi:hypothetical protein
VVADGPRIAFDARLVGYAAGIARYAVLLAEGLAKLDGPERYVLLRSRKADPRLGGRLCLTPPGALHATPRAACKPPAARPAA